jgi:hypothetical protein
LSPAYCDRDIIFLFMAFGNKDFFNGLLGEKRATTSPLRPMMNFSKFQLIFPGPTGFVSRVVKFLYKLQAPSPLTSTLANMSKRTP